MQREKEYKKILGTFVKKKSRNITVNNLLTSRPKLSRFVPYHYN